MRYLLLPAVACFAALAPAQIKMNVVVQGANVGTATLTQKLLPDGGKMVQLAMDLKGPGGTVRVRSENTYGADMKAKRKFLESYPGAGKRRQVIVDFSSDGADVTLEADGSRQKRVVPYPKDAKLENVSEFWFIKNTPKPGDTFKWHSFNVETLAWELETVQYVGMKTVRVSGRDIRGYEVKADKYTAILDSKGLPFLIETPSLRMERVFQ
jgi:hypothetical protein